MTGLSRALHIVALAAYAGALAAALLAGRRPVWRRPAAALALLGFAAVLFTYLGLGLRLKSNHPLL